MKNIHLPPIPQLPASDPRVCEVVCLYLAVWNDLTPEQMQAASAHLQNCANCANEQRVLNHATRLVAALDSSSPSVRVDQAVMVAIAAHNKGHSRNAPYVLQSRRKYTIRRRGTPLQLAGLLVAAAIIVLATFATIHTVKVISPPQQAFILPSTLTWSTFVLYHSQTKLDAKGKRYRVNSYHDLSNNHINVETVQDNTLDVMLVSDGQNALGMDEMRHIAQWGANGWNVNEKDEAMFDLNGLRQDLNTHRATYLDEDQFKGQTVYRIRYQDGRVLLLDMNYHPVNVLVGAVGPGTGEPVYDTLKLLSPSNVPSSMWNMHVPAGFKMGALPSNP